jgi:hypothetical protein
VNDVHATCATPACRAFHLFCSDCGARYHLTDTITVIADGMSVLVDIAPLHPVAPAATPVPV